MRARQIGMTILGQFVTTRNQILITGALYAALCAFTYSGLSRGIVVLDLKSTAILLGSIATITALITSVSFAFVVFTLNQVNSRKHDLYFRFKTMLFEFDKFLKDYPPHDPIVSEALALSWDLKFIKIDDFPLRDWDQRLSSWVKAMEEQESEKEEILDYGTRDENSDPNLVNRILGYLGYLEDVISEIGIMCIRQIIAGRFISLVTKAIIVLAMLLVVLMLCYELNVPWLSPAIEASPVFFVVFAMLMMFEIAYYLHREDRENLSFVAWNDEESADEDKPAAPLTWQK